MNDIKLYEGNKKSHYFVKVNIEYLRVAHRNKGNMDTGDSELLGLHVPTLQSCISAYATHQRCTSHTQHSDFHRKEAQARVPETITPCMGKWETKIQGHIATHPIEIKANKRT